MHISNDSSVRNILKKQLTWEVLVNQENLERVCLAFCPARRRLVELRDAELASL